jgi:hypothetical protein
LPAINVRSLFLHCRPGRRQGQTKKWNEYWQGSRVGELGCFETMSQAEAATRNGKIQALDLARAS